MRIFLISDPHFGHERIIKYEDRPFSNADEMTSELINNWNSVVSNDDLVFCLGDVFFCKSEEQFDIAGKLNGRKILIKGNHDTGISNTKFRRLGFEVYNYYFLDDFILSHYPQDELGLREAIDRGLLRGNICGHLHGEGANLPKDVYQCVSVELINYTPVEFDYIKENFRQNIETCVVCGIDRKYNDFSYGDEPVCRFCSK